MKQTVAFFFLLLHTLIISGQDAVRCRAASIDPGNPDALCVGPHPAIGYHPKFTTSEMRSMAMRHDSTVDWTWDTGASVWDPEYRELFTYGENSNPTSSLYQRENGGWTDYFLYSYAYDSQDRLTEYIEQFWSINGWVNTYRYAYTYNEHDDLVEQLVQQWNVNNWKNFHQILFLYDSLHNLITQTNREWQAIAWVNSVKRENTYNEQNQISFQLRQDWDGGWVNRFQYFYTYDTLNLLRQYYSERWESNTWARNFRNEYEYDDRNNRILLQRQNPAFSNLWSFDYQFVYTYDEQNQLISDTEQDHQSTTWINVDRFVFTYDDDQNQTSELYQEWADAWLNVDSTHYYYNPLSANESIPQDTTRVIIFPNPATDRIYIQMPDAEACKLQIEGYSHSGQKLFEAIRFCNDGNFIDISLFPPGSYYLRVLSDNKVIIGRFVKT